MIPRRLRRPPHRLCSSHSTRRRRRNHPRPARRFGTASRGTTPELRGAPPGQRQRRPQRPPRPPSTRPRPPPELPHPADRTRRVRARHARGRRARVGTATRARPRHPVRPPPSPPPPQSWTRVPRGRPQRQSGRPREWTQGGSSPRSPRPRAVPQRARAARQLPGTRLPPARPELAPLLHCSPGRAQPTVLPRERRCVAASSPNAPLERLRTQYTQRRSTRRTPPLPRRGEGEGGRRMHSTHLQRASWARAAR